MALNTVVKNNIKHSWYEIVEKTPDEWINMGDVGWLEHGGLFIKMEEDGESFEVIKVEFHEYSKPHFFSVETYFVDLEDLIEEGDAIDPEGNVSYKFKDRDIARYGDLLKDEGVLGTLNKKESASEGLYILLHLISSSYYPDEYPLRFELESDDKYSDEWEAQWECQARKVESFLKNSGLDRDWEYLL